MRLFRCSLLGLLVLSSPQASASFTDIECIESNFQTNIDHPIKPFGLFKQKLKIDKTDCTIEISTEKYKYLKEHWVIDVCRAPIHIKEGGTAIDVFRYEGQNCHRLSRDQYCIEYFKIIESLQNDGLVFAKGSKENLQNDHGKVFCASLLINTYLKEGHVLSTEEKFNLVKLRKQRTLKEHHPLVSPPKSKQEGKLEDKVIKEGPAAPSPQKEIKQSKVL